MSESDHPYIVKRSGYEKEQKENALIVYQILSTNSVKKCMKISFKNKTVSKPETMSEKRPAPRV